MGSGIVAIASNFSRPCWLLELSYISFLNKVHFISLSFFRLKVYDHFQKFEDHIILLILSSSNKRPYTFINGRLIISLLLSSTQSTLNKEVHFWGPPTFLDRSRHFWGPYTFPIILQHLFSALLHVIWITINLRLLFIWLPLQSIWQWTWKSSRRNRFSL